MSYADRFAEKLYTVKRDVPTISMGYAFSAMGYVLERIVQRFEEAVFTPKVRSASTMASRTRLRRPTSTSRSRCS